MRHLYDDEIKWIFTDDSNLLTIDAKTMYLHHIPCGGLKMFLVFHGNSLEVQELVKSMEMTPVCRCHRPPVRFIDRSGEKDLVQQTLANVFVELGQCRSLEDARLMVEEMASREEMRGTEQLL